MTDPQLAVLAKLAEQNDAILQELRSPRKAGWLDWLNAVSTVVSVVVLGSLSMYFSRIDKAQEEQLTRASNEFQRQVQQATAQLDSIKTRTLELEVAEKFLSHLELETRRGPALIMMAGLGQEALARRLARRFGETGVLDTLNAQTAVAISTTGANDGPGTAGGSARTGPGERCEGWVLLGLHDGAWTERFLEFPRDASVESLIGRAYPVREVTGALNMRSGLITESGELPPVVRVLEEGTDALVTETRKSPSSSAIWGCVDVQ